MRLVEVNFDGLIGPTHNYCGLSPGNLASAAHADAVAHPCAAALQGLQKMRRVMALGAVQGFFPPPLRPAAHALRPYGFAGSDDEVLIAAGREDPLLLRAACSASSMWTANAATVIAASDSADGRTHIVCANLASMPHRAMEAADTHALLRTVFADAAIFAVHPPLPLATHFADEGAANQMRLAGREGGVSVNVFVHGEPRGGRFPERQALRASQAVARLAGVREPIFALQAARAIQAGAFHNDVAAVSHENVLLAHRDAFEDQKGLIAQLHARVPGFRYIEIDRFDLATAVSTYPFNAQIITRSDGGMTLVAPAEARANPAVWAEVERLTQGNGPIDQAIVVDLRESMRNGGGPACLRLRVPMPRGHLARLDRRFLLDARRLDALAALVERAWPQTIEPADLADPALWAHARAAHAALMSTITGWAGAGQDILPPQGSD